jgi:hypothetical protein
MQGPLAYYDINVGGTAVPELIADPRRVEGARDWRTTRDITAMCVDA